MSEVMKITMGFIPSPDALALMEYAAQHVAGGKYLPGDTQAEYVVKYAVSASPVERDAAGNLTSEPQFIEAPDLKLPIDALTFTLEAPKGHLVDSYIAFRSAKGVLSQAMRMMFEVQDHAIPRPVQQFYVHKVVPRLAIVGQDESKPISGNANTYFVVVPNPSGAGGTQLGTLMEVEQEDGKASGAWVVFDDQTRAFLSYEAHTESVEVIAPDQTRITFKAYIETQLAA